MAEQEMTLDLEVEMFGDKTIRWYQTSTRNGVLEALRSGVRRILIGSPTGTGKTTITAITLNSPELHEILGVKNRPLRVVFLAHIHRLLTQAEETFADGMNVEILMRTPFTKIPDEDILWADIIVMDEAHHEAMMSVQYQLDTLTTIPIIGMTATPERADGLLIKFEVIINPLSREQAVEEGWLAETSIWSFVDMSGRNKVGIVHNILDNYADIMGPTIVFMRTRAEALAVHQHIEKLGYTSECLISQSAAEIDAIIDDMKSDRVQFVVNCSKIGEGVDVPSCMSVVLGKQVASYPLLNQNIGRAARPDSDCQVFELINPLKGSNLDTTVVVGTPKQHLLCDLQQDGTFVEREFNYVGFHTGMETGVGNVPNRGSAM